MASRDVSRERCRGFNRNFIGQILLMNLQRLPKRHLG
jgi:hypothetical protein